MAEERNGIISKLDVLIRCSDTPEELRVMLLCQRDMYCMLRDHLKSHERWGAPAKQVAVAMLTALATTWAVWYFLGQLGI